MQGVVLDNETKDHALAGVACGTLSNRFECGRSIPSPASVHYHPYTRKVASARATCPLPRTASGADWRSAQRGPAWHGWPGEHDAERNCELNERYAGGAGAALKGARELLSHDEVHLLAVFHAAPRPPPWRAM